MPTQIKQLSGIMDTDSSNEVIAPTHHKYAKNLRFPEVNGNTRPEIIKGTTLIPNSLLPSIGVNECIGCFYDQKKQRIFFFEWNSVGSHGIYIYYTNTGLFDVLLQCGTATDGDILRFNLQRYITSVDVIYGGEADGDLLIFLDSLKRPTKLNIDRYLFNPYPTTKRSFIDVAKIPFPQSVNVTYENDDTVTINNLKNSLFQFVVRPVYDDNEKAVFSTGSAVSLPFAPFDYQNDTDASKNSRIAIYVPTGGEDIKKLEIICRQSKSGGTSDYFLVASLNKAELGIPDNKLYRYVFYNDGLYPFLDIKEASLLFDYVPREANACTILNGNIPILGGIKEGYNKIVPILSATNSITLLPYNSYNGVLFFGFQSSGTTITLYLTGAGANDGLGNATTLSNPPANLYVKCTDSLFVDTSFTYANASSSIPTILAGISAAAVVQGFVQVSLSTNTLVLSHVDGVKLNSAGLLRSVGTTFNTNEAVYCYAPEANYSFGVQYYDEKGVTNGVFTAPEWAVKTQPYGSNQELPLVQLFISHRPPIWAAYYQLMRTNDLTYLKRLHWVSKGAFEAFSPTGVKHYAYIDVSNIIEYNQDISSTDKVVTYDFAPGDRIQFISRRPFGSSRVVLPHLDYEVVGMQATINLNGTTKTGNFVQIVYPTADISADFKFDGSFDFLHYEVLLYALKPHTDNETNVYYEFGRQYSVGNPGTTSAYHIGQEQTQSVDLVTPAQINVCEGDYFYRQRAVPVGITYDFNMPGYANGFADTTTIHIDVPASPITTPYYQFTSTTYAAAGKLAGQYPFPASANYIYQNLTGATQRLRVRTKFIFTNDFDVPNFELFFKMVNNPIPVASVVIYDMVALTGGLIANQSHTFDIDTTVSVYAGSKLFPMVYKTGSQTFHSGGTWSFEVLDDDNINIIEDSFSDVYAIKKNSNSRTSKVDENAKELFLPTTLRWGLAYEADSNVNQMNRFYPLNFDEIDRANGDIQRLLVEERNLYAYQNRAVGVLGIYAKFLQDSGDTNVVTTTDEIITRNNVRYLLGEYGIGEYPEAVIRGRNCHYFADVIRGYLVRRAGDGMTAISELYKGKYYIRQLLTKYNNQWVTPNGGRAKVFGFYDFFDEQYVTLLQGGISDIPVPVSIPVADVTSPLLVFTISINNLSNIHLDANEFLTAPPTYSIVINGPHDTQFLVNAFLNATIVSDILNLLQVIITNALINTFSLVENTDFTVENDGDYLIYTFDVSTGYDITITDITPGESIPPYAFSFNEPRNGFASFYDYAPDWIICAEDVTYSWKDGLMYIHNNESASNYSQFYGFRYFPEITLVFNDKGMITKTFDWCSYQANRFWESPANGDIVTSQPNPQTSLPQISQLKAVDYEINEGKYNASFLRDANSGQNPAIAVLEGDFLKGVNLQQRFIYRGNNYAYFFAPSVSWSISNKNY